MNIPKHMQLIADKIGMPVEDWRGNCHVVAGRFLDHGIVHGRIRRGLWCGYIHPLGFFGTRWASEFTGHTWILKDDGEVCDPTRWVFEGCDPYIHTGPEDADYDYAGDRLRQLICRDFPEAGDDERSIRLPEGPLRDMIAVASGHRVGAGDMVTRHQAIWICNLPLAVFHQYPVEALQWAENTPEVRRAWFPMDVWNHMQYEAALSAGKPPPGISWENNDDF